MRNKFKRILYGGDYNPNQWSKNIWNEDMRLFKDAHINSATINVFSWAKLQPSEEQYDFKELDEIIEMLTRENYDIVLATSTAALPAWMVKRYPEVARTDYEGRHHMFGHRHNACPNSPVYQKYATRLAEKLAQRYCNNKQVVCWHINNEYGGECYCENCEKAFRIWLRKKYQDLKTLNAVWNTEFWGHTFYNWDEIVLPNALSEGLDRDKTSFAGISIDYRRFNSDSMLENYKMEREAVRRFDNDTPITTNLMGTYKGLDYFKWAKEMDIVSWDNYPGFDTPWSHTAMCHDLMRGLKDTPFMLMEQTPSQSNWHPYNSLKKPGQMRAQSYQTIAHGADTIQFFQLRQSVGGCEKFHGAVIAHAGTNNTRVFREVQQLGLELEGLGDFILGAETISEVGLIFDWDNYWAAEYTCGPTIDLKYVEQIQQYYQYFYEKNITVNMVPCDAEFKKYKLIVAPLLYMVKEGVKESLEAFVKEGGVLITTFMSGIVNQSDNVYLGGYPGPLRQLAGIWVEEMDAPASSLYNRVRFQDGMTSYADLVCSIIHTEGAECLGTYECDFYAKSPAVTKNTFGKGIVYYIGTRLDSAGTARVLDMAIAEANVHTLIPEISDLEITCRQKEKCKYYFVINFKEQDRMMPQYFVGRQDILTGRKVREGDVLSRFDVRIICVDEIE